MIRSHKPVSTVSRAPLQFPDCITTSRALLQSPDCITTSHAPLQFPDCITTSRALLQSPDCITTSHAPLQFPDCITCSPPVSRLYHVLHFNSQIVCYTSALTNFLLIALCSPGCAFLRKVTGISGGETLGIISPASSQVVIAHLLLLDISLNLPCSL